MIYQEGESSNLFLTVLEGWALRFAMTRDGRRQVLSFLLGGDHVALDSLSFDRMTFSVQAITDCTICAVDRTTINRLVGSSPSALERLEGRHRFLGIGSQQHIISLGRRSAAGRIAQLFLEMKLRLAARGFKDESRLPFPIRQRDIADAYGLTPVHVNRVLRSFRAEGVAELARGTLSIIDGKRLSAIAGLKELDQDITRYGVNLSRFEYQQ